MKTTGNDVRLYKRLLLYVLPYWRTFMISIISMLVLAISDPAIPALIKPLLDGAFVEKDPVTMKWVPIIFVLLFAIKSWIKGLVINRMAKIIFPAGTTMVLGFVINDPSSIFSKYWKSTFIFF